MNQERNPPESVKELGVFTATGRKLFQTAAQEAYNVKSVNVDPGHLVMAACRTHQSVAYSLLLQMGVSIEELYQKLKERFEKENIPDARDVKAGRVLPNLQEIGLSDKTKVAIERAVSFSKEFQDRQINSGLLLLGCFKVDDSGFFDQAKEVYARFPPDREEILEYEEILEWERYQRYLISRHKIIPKSK